MHVLVGSRCTSDATALLKPILEVAFKLFVSFLTKPRPLDRQSRLLRHSPDALIHYLESVTLHVHYSRSFK